MDPEMFDIIEREKKRQQESVDLIPSEVISLQKNIKEYLLMNLHVIELYFQSRYGCSR